MNTTNIASSKLYQEGNLTCVATNKYGTDVKHFTIKGEKIRYFGGMGVEVGETILHNSGLDTNGSQLATDY